jgi:hypothetical protein
LQNAFGDKLGVQVLQGGNLEAIESVHKTKEQKHGSPSTIDKGERIGDVLDDM